MSKELVAWVQRVWNEYTHNKEKYNHIGRTNLVASIGEKTTGLLEYIAELEAENANLRQHLETLKEEMTHLKPPP